MKHVIQLTLKLECAFQRENCPIGHSGCEACLRSLISKRLAAQIGYLNIMETKY